MQDWPLLRRYVENQSESAFAELQTRYVHLVYAACLRELGSREMAEDATQVVFLLLAKRASRFRRESALYGWLFQTARFVSRNLRKSERRRADREHKAADLALQGQVSPDTRWNQLEPMLNEALATLKAVERECLLLRFFGESNYAQIAAATGLTVEAARKRTDRALEKVRRYFAKRDWYLTDSALAGMLTAPDLHAPAACLAAVSNIASGKINISLLGSSLHQLLQGASKAMKIAQWKWAAGIAAVAVVGVGGLDLAFGQEVTPTPPPFNINDPISSPPESMIKPQLPDGPDAIRNASIYGKLLLPNGQPAQGVLVACQVTNAAMTDWFNQDEKKYRATQFAPKKRQNWEREASWNNSVTDATGLFSIPVAGNTAYNVMVIDTTGKYVAAAAQNVQAKPHTGVLVGPLQLTPGAVAQGYVRTPAGQPLAKIDIGNYGPARPDTSAAVNSAQTDAAGFYRIRLAPGKNLLYDMMTSNGPSREIVIAPGQIKTVNLTVR